MNALTPTDWTAHYAAVKLRLGCGQLKPIVNVKRPVEKTCEVYSQPERNSFIVKEIDGFKFGDVVNLTPVILEALDGKVTGAMIIKAVSETYGLKLGEIKGHRRQVRITMPRQIAMWICRNAMWEYSLPQIGKLFGGKDHTTVLHAVRKIDKMLADGSLTIPDHLLALTRPQVEG